MSNTSPDAGSVMRNNHNIESVFRVHIWDPAWLRVFLFMMERLWSRDRSRACRLLRWLLAEIDHGHDDVWHTLAFRAGRLLGTCATVHGQDEERLARDVANRTLAAWLFTIRNRYGYEHRQHAHQALAGAARGMPRPLLARLEEMLQDGRLGDSAVEALGAFGENDVEGILRNALKHSDCSSVRAAALRALCEMGVPSSLEDSIEALGDDDGFVRRTAVKILENDGSTRAVDSLIGTLHKGVRVAMSEVVEALGNLRETRALGPLINVVCEEGVSEYTRGSAAEAIGKIAAASEQNAQGGRSGAGDHAGRNSMPAEGRIGPAEAIASLCDVLARSQSVGFCEKLIEAIFSLGGKKAVEALTKGLEHPNPHVAGTAARFLGKTRATPAIMLLVKALQDPREPLRVGAAVGLGWFKEPTAETALVGALRDDNRHVRRAAMRALGNIGSESAVRAILDSIGDDDSSWSVDIALALLPSLGCEGTVDALVGRLDHGAAAVRENVPSIMEWLASDFSESYLTKHRSLPEDTARTLHEYAATRGVDALLRALNDDDPVLRRRVASSLSTIAAPRAAPRLTELLQDGDEIVRLCAAEGLSYVGTDPAVDPLLVALNDPVADVRTRAAHALGKIGSKRAVHLLIRALSDEDKKTRACAAEALGRIGADEAEASLIGMLRDEDGGVRACVARALGSIKCEKAVPGLIEALGDEVTDVRWRAAKALGEIGAAEAVDALVAALSDENRFVRRDAIGALRKMPSERAVDPLIGLLKDKNPEVRGDVADALGIIGSDRAIDDLVSLLPDSTFIGAEDLPNQVCRKAADALNRIGSDRTVDVLIADLTGVDAARRKVAFQGLMLLKAKSARKRLVSVLGDERGDAGYLLSGYHTDQGCTILPTGEQATLADRRLHESLYPDVAD